MCQHCHSLRCRISNLTQESVSRTGELIGCISVDLSVTGMNAAIQRVRPVEGILAIVDYASGEVVANSEDLPLNAIFSDTKHLSDLGITDDKVVLCTRIRQPAILS